MAVCFVLAAMTQQGHTPLAAQRLQEAKGELLTMVLDRPVLGVHRAGFEKLPAVPSPEHGSAHMPRVKCPQKLLARAEIGHPDVVTRLAQTSAVEACHKDAQAIQCRSIGE